MHIDRVQIRKAICVVTVSYIKKQCNNLMGEILDIDTLNIESLPIVESICHKYCTTKELMLQQLNILELINSNEHILLDEARKTLLRLYASKDTLESVLCNLLVLYPIGSTSWDIELLLHMLRC